MEDEALLNLSNIWHIVRKKFYFIIITTLLGTLVTAYTSYFIIKPTYKVNMTLFIGNNFENSDARSLTDSVDLYQKLMKTYVLIAKSSVVAEKTIQKLNLTASPEDLQDSISVSTKQDTQVLDISLKSKDPMQAVETINTFGQAFIDEGKRLYPTGDVKIIDSAKFPTSPANPSIFLNIAIAAFLGFILSAGIVVTAELLNRTIRTEEDVEKYLNTPVLGMIFKENKLNKSQLVVLDDPESASSEAYRTLRTNIEFSSVGKKVRTILFTSASSADGKSTTAANLAIVMAQAGKKVLFIDCDLRKASAHRIFNMSNSTGLSNYLAEAALMHEIINKTINENLSIITAGVKPPNPAELLSSEKMKQFIDLLKEKYDYIILDTPPVGLVTDAQILSKYADECILVISAGSTDRCIIARAKELLQIVNAKLLGVVLNRVDIKCLYGCTDYYREYY